MLQLFLGLKFHYLNLDNKLVLLLLKCSTLKLPQYILLNISDLNSYRILVYLNHPEFTNILQLH